MRPPFKKRPIGTFVTRAELCNPYAYLNDTGGFDGEAGAALASASSSNPENLRNARLLLENQYAYLEELEKINRLKAATTPIKEVIIRREEIERLARSVHLDIWHMRKSLWPKHDPDLIELLDPAIAIKLRGVDFEVVDSLGEFQDELGRFEVAGQLDRAANRISVARNQSRGMQRFTAAHELGHWLMHENEVSHRDRPFEGPSSAQEPGLSIERQANYFAACFLMPRKLLADFFREIFEVKESFLFNREAAHKLKISSSLPKSQKEKAFLLASTEYYNGKHFESVATRFKVSVSAMAYRLIELKLVQ